MRHATSPRNDRWRKALTRDLPLFLDHHHRQLASLSATDKTTKQKASKTTVDSVDPLIKINQNEKTITTPVGSLPMSPLFDSSWRKARQRGKLKKPQPDESKYNRFQRRMEENPYARILAEPVRSCHVTRIRLPRFFLQDFGIVQHPETKEIWWIPGDFHQTPQPAASQAFEENEKAGEIDESLDERDEPLPTRKPTPSDFDVDEAQSDDSQLDDSREGAESATATEPSPKPAQEQGGARFRAPAHALARQDLLMEILNAKSTHYNAHMKMATMMKTQKAFQAGWRSDMHEVIRDQMRSQLTNDLVYLSTLCENKGADYLIPEDETQLKRYWFRTCYLWLGDEPRKPFETLEIDGLPGSARPVYDLPRLLGSEHVERLKAEAPKLLTGPLVLVKRRRTENLINKRLWRLQGFLADYSTVQ